MHWWRTCVIKQTSCGRRWADCTTSAMLKRRQTRSPPSSCSYRSPHCTRRSLQSLSLSSRTWRCRVQQSLGASELQHQEDSSCSTCSSDLQSRLWALAAHTDRKLCPRKPLSHLCLSPVAVWEVWGKEQWCAPASGTKTPLLAQPVTWQSMLLARNLGPGYTMDRLLLRLVVAWPLDYYPQLLFHSGTIVRGDQECTKRDYTVHKVLAKACQPRGASFMLLVKGENLRRSRQIPQMNKWLCSIYIHRTFHEDQELSMKGSKIHLKLHGVKASLPRGWLISSGNA